MGSLTLSPGLTSGVRTRGGRTGGGAEGPGAGAPRSEGGHGAGRCPHCGEPVPRRSRHPHRLWVPHEGTRLAAGAGGPLSPPFFHPFFTHDRLQTWNRNPSEE